MAFSSRRSSLTQTFVESCVDFEVADLSIHISILEIPTLGWLALCIVLIFFDLVICSRL